MVNRSTTCRSPLWNTPWPVVSALDGAPSGGALCPTGRVFSVKFVTSTTEVLPSQWPRESPIPRRISESTCGRPSSGMGGKALDARVEVLQLLVRQLAWVPGPGDLELVDVRQADVVERRVLRVGLLRTDVPPLDHLACTVLRTERRRADHKRERDESLHREFPREEMARLYRRTPGRIAAESRFPRHCEPAAR